MSGPSSIPELPTDEALTERLRRRLVDLVAVASPSWHEKQLADQLEQELSAHPALQVQRCGDNLRVQLRGVRELPRVLFCGHLDTVPAQDNPTPRVEGDRVYGLGSSDLKAGLAVLLELMTDLEPEALAVAPVFVFYAREEISYRESGLIEADEQWPDLRQVDFGICVEPTGNAVELGCLGTLHALVTVAGTSAHSARPWLGRNAVHAGVPLLQRIADLPMRSIRAPESESIEFREVLNVTEIRGGLARNVLPPALHLNLNFRFGPDRTGEQACQFIRELVGDDGTVEFPDVSPSGRVCLENPFCRALIEQCQGEIRAKQAWTDVGRLTEWGIDSVSWGPGHPEKAHQQDEYASVSNMVEYARRWWRFLHTAAPPKEGP